METRLDEKFMGNSLSLIAFFSISSTKLKYEGRDFVTAHAGQRRTKISGSVLRG